MAKATVAKKAPAAKTKKQEVKKTKDLHVSLVVDRSGSMSSIRSDIIGALNNFFHDQQKQQGLCRLTINQFDDQSFDTLFEAMDINDVRDVTDADFIPRGMTPLFDAIGKTITQAQIRSESSEGKNEQPLIVILTDGLENASREYTQKAIKDLIAAKEAQGWIFTYLGANHDSYLQAGAIGMHVNSTQNYKFDQMGTRAVVSNVSAAVRSTRTRLIAGQSVSSANLYAETGKTAEEDWQARTGQNSGASDNSVAKSRIPEHWSKSGKKS